MPLVDFAKMQCRRQSFILYPGRRPFSHNPAQDFAGGGQDRAKLPRFGIFKFNAAPGNFQAVIPRECDIQRKAALHVCQTHGR